MKLVPLIPARLVAMCIVVGGLLMAGSAFAPTPWNLVLAAVGSTLLYLGGQGWKLPTWAAGKPLLPLTLVPLALSAVALLERFLPLLPLTWQGWGTFAVGFLSLLAGKVTPEPMRLEAGAAGGSTQVQLASGCSLEDAARGLCK